MTRWPLCFHRKSQVKWLCFNHLQNSTVIRLVHRTEASLFLCGLRAPTPPPPSGRGWGMDKLKPWCVTDRAAVLGSLTPHRQTALCLHLLEDYERFSWHTASCSLVSYANKGTKHKHRACFPKYGWTTGPTVEYSCQPRLFHISGLSWPTSPEGQTLTCLMPLPFSSRWGFSWVFSAGPLWWVLPQESSLLSYPFSETKRWNETGMQSLASSLVRVCGRRMCTIVLMSVVSLTPLPRHQVHQASLFPTAGDSPLLPHVLEHLPAGRGLRVHRWVVLHMTVREVQTSDLDEWYLIIIIQRFLR